MLNLPFCSTNCTSQVGLTGVALNVDPDTLSGGYKRRLALAIQLVRIFGINYLNLLHFLICSSHFKHACHCYMMQLEIKTKMVLIWLIKILNIHTGTGSRFTAIG